tara:strand:- start:40 stop:795 length:756 start_codon:yes stop_codon:yes gene_type:complete
MNLNTKKFNFGIIIQARYDSSRLKGKILKKINNIEILKIMYKRIEILPKFKNKIIINISKKNSTRIENFCKKNDLKYFVGSDSNVLRRYFDCANKFGIKHIIRIPSDCPLIDPKIIDRGLKIYQKKNYNYVTNLCPASYADGNDVEILDYKTLKYINDKSKNLFDKEHVTTYLRNRLYKFKCKNFYSKKDLSKTFRLTLDYQEDYLLIKKIVLKLGIYANYNQIINFLKKNKNLSSINKKYIGKMWYQKKF